MVSVKITARNVRKNIIVDGSKTIRNIAEENDMNYETAPIYLDGAPLNPGDMDKSLSALGIIDHCVLTQVVKTDNA